MLRWPIICLSSELSMCIPMAGTADCVFACLLVLIQLIKHSKPNDIHPSLSLR